MNLDKDQSYIFTVPGVLTPEDCRQLIDRIEEEGPRTAPINTIGGPRVNLTVRNNERIMFDDPELAADLLSRVKGRVPKQIHGMVLCGVNERFRCYRYKPGMRFAPHSDGAFFRSDTEQSWYTFMVYLNEEFEGGQTTFLVEPPVSISPETGMALFFQHPLIHEGSVVTTGVKYVLRTDVMYHQSQ